MAEILPDKDDFIIFRVVAINHFRGKRKFHQLKLKTKQRERAGPIVARAAVISKENSDHSQSVLK